MELNIGEEFSKDPAGRYYSDGPASGEQFREEVLKPRLQQLEGKEKLVIVLDDDVDSYGSSFLSEGFAAMVKFGYVEAEELLEKLEFRHSDPDFAFFASRITEYISDAEFNSERYKPSRKN